MVFLLQSLVVVMAFAFTMLLRTFFIDVFVPLLGALIILYAALSHRKKSKKFNIFILISLILMLILSTGDISSSLFFLLYFLSFLIGFMFDPKVVFVYTAGLIVLFFPEAFKTDLTKNMFVLFSVIMLSPLAYFFGQSYQQSKEHRKKIKAISKRAQTVENDIEEVLYNNGKNLNSNTSMRLNEALEDIGEIEEEARKV